MPFDLAGSIRKTSQWAFGSPFLNNILGSSLFVAITIALLMILLVMIMYPAKKGTPISVLCKLFIYMFFGTLLIVFLHDSVIKFMFEDSEQEKEDIDFMRGTTQGGKDGIYNQSSMVSPLPSIRLGTASDELKSQQPLPVFGAPVNNNSNDNPDEHSDDEQEVTSVVEGGGGYLGGSRVPQKKPNLFR